MVRKQMRNTLLRNSRKTERGGGHFLVHFVRTAPLALFSLAAGLLGPSYLTAQAPQFTIQDLGTLPNLPACNGTALSQSGAVVGYCTSQAGQDLLVNAPTTHVFLYANGAMKDLNISSPASAFPTGINNSNAVVGGALAAKDLSDITNVNVTSSAFIYANGKLQPPPEGLANALPLALNNTGQTAATTLQIIPGSWNYFEASGAFLLPVSGATVELFSPDSVGTPAALGINSTGTVAGAVILQGATNTSPLLWQSNGTPQTLPLLANYTNAVATSVNDSGVAAGIAFNIDFTQLMDANAMSHAVLFNTNGSVTDLGALPGDANSMATGINNAGSVVGFSSTAPPTFTLQLAALLSPPASKYHAFIYSGGKMYHLNEQLVNGAGWELSYATQINNSGQIVGTGLFNGLQHAFLLSPMTVALSPSIESIVGAGLSSPPITSLSPNGLFAIFGSELASQTAVLTAGDIVDNQLPTNLGGTCVESGSTKWGLFFVAPGQINALAGELPASGTVPVTVVANCGTANESRSAVMNVPVAPVAPEFLYFIDNSNGQNPVAAVVNGSNPVIYVGAPGLYPSLNFKPAQAGDVIEAFGVGWGPTNPSNTPGTIPSGAATLTGSYSVTLGGMPAKVLYAGLAPGDAGLYQLDFTVPAGLSAGNQPLVIKIDGVSSEAGAYITVGN
jgi:uncharacterized protein (TIGR03437 family)